jgi:hypothetical protein
LKFENFQFKSTGGNQTLAARARTAGLEPTAIAILNGRGLIDYFQIFIPSYFNIYV